jgi:hypothetical protein
VKSFAQIEIGDSKPMNAFTSKQKDPK